ncbi:MAG: hypothetical protein FWD31_10130, partial [Planctomycetaceae bacterium]|nr:hypothetical protein [Planctomycetaceae bacterium]
SCRAEFVDVMVLNDGVVESKKNVPMMTLPQVRECIGCMLLGERLNVCDQSVVGSPSAKRIPLFPLYMLAQQNQTSHRKLLESMIFADFVVVTC